MTLKYITNENFKFYKEVYGTLIEYIERIRTTWRARKVILRIMKHLPSNWHVSFYYSNCTESSINFWHTKIEEKEEKPSHVFKGVCDSLSEELDIKFSKSYGVWDNELESLQASSSFGGFGIHIYQYQVNECTFFVEEVKVKKVVLTGDCVNF